MFFEGFGFVCFLMKLTPSTIRPHLRGVDPQTFAAGPLLAALAGDDEDHVVLAHVEISSLRGPPGRARRFS